MGKYWDTGIVLQRVIIISFHVLEDSSFISSYYSMLYNQQRNKEHWKSSVFLPATNHCTLNFDAEPSNNITFFTLLSKQDYVSDMTQSNEHCDWSSIDDKPL